MLGLLIPMCEPMGWHTIHMPAAPGADAATIAAAAAAPPIRPPGSLLAYQYHTAAVAAIIISAILGLLVSLSTFLVIGATSSLTYNVVGHLKTLIILTGGCMFFGDTMPLKKFIGVCIAMMGIIWYTQQKLASSSGAAAAGAAASGDPAAAAAGPRPPLLPISNSPVPVSVKSVYTATAARSRGAVAAAAGGGGPMINGRHHAHR